MFRYVGMNCMNIRMIYLMNCVRIDDGKGVEGFFDLFEIKLNWKMNK